MLQIQDKSTQEIVCQIYNFVDLMGGVSNMTVDTIEKFLITRGVLKPPGELKKTLTDKKDRDAYELANESSYLNKANLNEDHVDELNEEMREAEQIIDFAYHADTINYKKELLKSFRQVNDPFNVEILGEEADFDYEMNPSDMSQPKKTVEISKFKTTWQ
jgi:hypothetical protein|tara:strand:- start:586 stop:1065 length:480 start_codon:yes stop_codon:yes gene_type:complete